MAENGFDFGKWATTGLPFLSRDQERQERKKSLKNALCKAVRPENPATANKDWAEEFVKDMCRELCQWKRAINQWKQQGMQQCTDAIPWTTAATSTFEQSYISIITPTSQSAASSDQTETVKTAETIATEVLRGCPSMVLPKLSGIKRKFVHDVVGAGDLKTWAASQGNLRMNLSELEDLSEWWGDCVGLTLDSDQQEQGGRFSSLRIVWLPPAEQALSDFLSSNVHASAVLSTGKELSLKDMWYSFKAMLSERESMERIDADVGFRRVVDMISRESMRRGLPVVGHNLMGDLLHLTDKMTKSPPPASPVEWAAETMMTFPCIFDTKMLSGGNVVSRVLKELETRALQDPAEVAPMEVSDTRLTDGVFLKHATFWGTHKTTALDPVYQTIMSDRPFSESPLHPNGNPTSKITSWSDLVKVERDDALETSVAGTSSCDISEISVAHDAGYDAWMTGCIFAKYIAAVGLNVETLGNVGRRVVNVQSANGETLPVAGQKLFEYVNTLYLMRMTPCSWKIASENGETEQLKSKSHLLTDGMDSSILDRLPAPERLEQDDLSVTCSTVHITGLNHSIKTSDLLDMAADAITYWAQYASPAMLDTTASVCMTDSDQVQQFIQSIVSSDETRASSSSRINSSQFFQRSPIAWVDDDSAFFLFKSPQVAAAAIAGWATQKYAAAKIARGNNAEISQKGIVLPPDLLSSLEESISKSDPEDVMNKWRSKDLPLLGAFDVQSYQTFEESYPEIFAFSKQDPDEAFESENVSSPTELIKTPSSTFGSVSSRVIGKESRKRPLQESSSASSSTGTLDSSPKKPKTEGSNANTEDSSSCLIQ